MSTVVYWLLNAEDQILYVGCTNNLHQRMRFHSSNKAWWSSVDSIAHTDPMPRDEALRVERDDIETLRPVHNVQHRTGIFPTTPVDINLSADFISSMEAARILGIDRATLNRQALRGLVPIAITAPGVTGPRLFLRSDIEALAKKRAA